MRADVYFCFDVFARLSARNDASMMHKKERNGSTAKKVSKMWKTNGRAVVEMFVFFFFARVSPNSRAKTDNII